MRAAQQQQQQCQQQHSCVTWSVHNEPLLLSPMAAKREAHERWKASMVRRHFAKSATLQSGNSNVCKRVHTRSSRLPSPQSTTLPTHTSTSPTICDAEDAVRLLHPLRLALALRAAALLVARHALRCGRALRIEAG